VEGEMVKEKLLDQVRDAVRVMHLSLFFDRITG